MALYPPHFKPALMALNYQDRAWESDLILLLNCVTPEIRGLLRTS